MTIATILPTARTVFLDTNSNPIAGGSVYFYIPNTITLKTTWQDAAGSVANTNPVILDSNGSALIYGSGQYTQSVYDANSNLIYTGLTQDVYSLIVGGNTTFVSTVKKQLFTSSGTYTPSTGMLYAVAYATGGGGAGGGVAGDSSHGAGAAGGGAGSTSIKILTAAAVGASQVITIGAAGTAGTTGNYAGNAGGDTSIGSLCIGKGGSGGGGVAASGTAFATAGAGGVAGTGDFNMVGNAGGIGTVASNGASAATGAIGGRGASSYWGGLAAEVVATTSSATGTNANVYGAGGGGAAVSGGSGSSVAGGTGSKGVVLIIEYCSQ